MAADPYDAMQDARSEARYADDPNAEPTLAEVKDAALAPHAAEARTERDA